MNMERHMDLIRLMLIAFITGEEPPELKDYEQKDVMYHYTLLKDAGLIEAQFVDGNDAIPIAVAAVRVTWQGHEFYDASKEPKLWKMAKQEIMKQGASYTAQALLAWLKIEIHKRLTGAPPPHP
jgi:hypothetical protein